MKYKTGDILVGKGTGQERKVLGVCGLAVLISQYGDFKKASEDYYTEEEIDAYFTLKPSEWKPENSDDYYYVMSYGSVGKDSWSSSSDADKFRLATKNCFRTREEAEARLSEIKKEAGLI